MKYICFVLVFFIQHLCYSQNIVIEGIVVDNFDSPVSAASVQLTDTLTNKTISYTSTDSKGKFELSFSNNKDYLLTVNHLSFEEYKQEIKYGNTTTRLKIILQESFEELEEIVIISQAAVAKQNGDTISYNLKSLTTGNEQKLKDVISKLPGLEINDNGKITTNGKVINDLMVNGKKIFGDNHQMATENINAEMLEGIDLLNNYESFEAIKEIEGSDKTALNIKIKEEYLGRITGNVDAYGAYKERYKVHSNLFRFGTKSNITAIADLNNTGEQALSLKDYVNMSKSIKQDLRNNDASLSSFISLPSIPDFLLQNNNVETKKSEFVSFDFAYNASSKLSVNGFSIFDFTKSSEAVYSQKTFLNPGQHITTFDNQTATNRFFFNQTKLNLDYKPNRNSLLNYSVIFDPSNTKRNRYTGSEALGMNSVYEEDNNRFNYTFGHQLSYIIRIAENKLLSFNAFQELKQNDDDYSLYSNQFLFNQSINNLEQTKELKKNEIGVFAKYTQKLNQHILRVNSGYFSTRNRYSSDLVINAPLAEALRVDLDYQFLDASVMKKTGFFQYRFKAELRNSTIKSKDEKENVFQFYPSAQLKLAFSQTHNLTFSYNRTLDFPKIENLNDFFYANDFRNLVMPSHIAFSEVFTQNIFSLNYFRFDLYHGTVFMANTSLTKADKSVTTNTLNYSDFNEIENTISPSYVSWNSNVSFEQRISALKSKFKVNAGHILLKNYNFINHLENESRTNIYTVRASIISNFKNEIFNYEAGIYFSEQNAEYSLFDNQNNIKRLSPLLNINGRIKENFRYYINNSYETFKTTSSDRSFYDLGFKLLYDKNESKFRYWIEGVNILNMNNPEIIDITSGNNLFSMDVIRRMSGYIGIGASYEF